MSIVCEFVFYIFVISKKYNGKGIQEQTKKQTTHLINLYFTILLCINDCANKKIEPDKNLISDFYVLYEPGELKWNLYKKL